MISVVFWKWKKEGYRSQFTHEHVNTARDMVKRNTTLPVRFICVTDDPDGVDMETIPLWENPYTGYGSNSAPNCFYRLKAFDPEIKHIFGERFIWMDLDMIVLGNIDNIIGAPDDFAMWGDTRYNGQYNGSLCIMNAGARAHVWRDFQGQTSVQKAHMAGFWGSDQAWISYAAKMDGRKFGMQDGVYSYNVHLLGMTSPPENAKLVFFHGANDPWSKDVQAQHKWIRESYK